MKLVIILIISGTNDMDLLEPLLNYAQALSPAQWCQAFYILSAAGIAMLQLLPSDMRKALTDYGARRPKDQQADEEKESKGACFLAQLTSYGQVPHAWFLHFYIVSVALSGFWTWQYLHGGSVIRALAEMQSRSEDSSSVDPSRTFVAVIFMCLQGTRRLYECLFITKPGSTPMWIAHWALGLAFYTAMSVSVWIQGSDAILQTWESPQTAQLFNPRIMLAAPVFLLAGNSQYRCHSYLASLRKYTLPSEDEFERIICPHYMFECLLYLSLAFIAAPPGSLFNRTVLCGLVFVAVNLGATANGTKQWYASKFGADKVAGKWKMIPFVF